MRKLEKTTIKCNKGDDHKYEVMQMDAMRAIKAQAYLVKVLAPLIKDLNKIDLKKFGDGKTLSPEELELVGSLVQSLVGEVNDDKFHQFLINMCEEAMRDGERVDFNRDYTGNLMEAYKAFFFVLKANFGDFIAGARGSISALGVPVVSK